MWESAVVYSGLAIVVAGLGLVARPVRRLGVSTRWRGLFVAVSGALVAGTGLSLPARESRVARVETHLDAITPAWQFREVHTIRVAAPPARVFDAIRQVRADEILLFRTLTWIRRGGRPLPAGILDARSREPLLDVATRGGFVYLADAPPLELVVGTVVMAPPGARGRPTPELFRADLPPGFALATLNFLVKDDGGGGSLVTTETRVWANSASARRRFAAYWRVIYPGSAIIRRMWLRAIRDRATTPALADAPSGGTR